MKKLFFLAASLLLLSACGPKGPTQEQYDQLYAQFDSLTNHTNELQELIGTVNSSLDSISTQEGLLFINNDDGSKPTKKQMLSRIQAYKDLLARQQEQLAQLEKLEQQQTANRRSIAELKNIIAALREDIASKEARIYELEEELATKNRDISELRATLIQTESDKAAVTEERDVLSGIAQEQDRIINTGYYIVESKSVLKALGLMKGVFKKKADYANIDKSKFKEVDIREFTTLEIPNRVKMLTEKPQGSYLLVEHGGSTTLTITDPTRFWEASPYLIFMRK